VNRILGGISFLASIEIGLEATRAGFGVGFFGVGFLVRVGKVSFLGFGLFEGL